MAEQSPIHLCGFAVLEELNVKNHSAPLEQNVPYLQLCNFPLQCPEHLINLMSRNTLDLWFSLNSVIEWKSSTVLKCKNTLIKFLKCHLILASFLERLQNTARIDTSSFCN